MNWQFRWQLALVIGLLGFVGLIVVGLTTGFAEDKSPWLSSDGPVLSKIADLTPSVPPQNKNADCRAEIYTSGDGTPSKTLCAFESPLGTLTAEGYLKTGESSYARLYGQTTQDTFLPTVEPDIALVSLSAPTIGNNIGIYYHLTKADLRHNLGAGAGEWYDTTAAPDAIIKNPVTNTPLQIAAGTIAFSRNGEWMTADMPHQGLVRVHMTDLSVQLFTGSLEPSWFLGQPTVSLAISDDGRYVAVDNDTLGASSLTIYDTSTCTDQLNAVLRDADYCSGQNIWNGTTAAGAVYGMGILTKNPAMRLPVNIRFADDENITFEAEYDVSDTAFKVASFSAAAPGSVQHKLGLLGLGDSYISGQGTFNYVNGTDTQNDFCHLSPLSYPFLLGAQFFDSYNSVACSGAVTGNVVGRDDHYKGQVHDGIPASKRDTNSILTNFLPGYLYQQEFATTYLPEAMLLSVGGDNIGFADIVKQCVANANGGTCYNTYEDRLELIKTINAAYSDLVHTYQTLRTQSAGARLYVVGYPQIAKPDGDCGLNVHLNKDEVAFSAQLVSYLNSVIKSAASTAGVFYVDTEAAFNGHRLCEAPAGQSAMNGFTVGEDAGVTIQKVTINFIGSESYHPTVLGYQLLAAAIAQQTHNLSAPMPAPADAGPPTVDPNAAILQNVPHENRTVSTVYYNNDLAPDVTAFGRQQNLSLTGTDYALRPGSAASVVLHSQPVTLANTAVDANGNVQASITIPDTVEPGYHTLHVYGTALDGSPVDIQKIVYVARSSDDFNHGCGPLTASGVDADADGLDDACDPDIGPAKANLPSVGGLNTTVGNTEQPGAADGNASLVNGLAGAVVSESEAPEAPHILAANISSTQAAGLPTTLSIVPSKAQLRPKLYRLNWTYVAAGGLALSLVVTAWRYTWQKS